MGLRSVTSDSRVVFPNLVSADAPPVIIPEGVSPSQNSRSGYCNKPFLNSDEKALCLRNQVKPFGEVVEVRPKSTPPPKPRGDEQYYDEFFRFHWLSDKDVPTAVKFLGTGLAIASSPVVALGVVTGCSDESTAQLPGQPDRDGGMSDSQRDSSVNSRDAKAPAPDVQSFHPPSDAALIDARTPDTSPQTDAIPPLPDAKPEDARPDACVPMSVLDNTCNNQDDNCNGIVDENYELLPTTCGIGACENEGASSCVNGVEENVCQPNPPRDEVCDGVDNDCNALVDDGLQIDTGRIGIFGGGIRGVYDYAPKIFWNGAGYDLFWKKSRDEEENSGFWLTKLDPCGNPIGDSAQMNNDPSGVRIITRNDDGYFIAWSPNNREVRFTQIDSNGQQRGEDTIVGNYGSWGSTGVILEVLTSGNEYGAFGITIDRLHFTRLGNEGQILSDIPDALGEALDNREFLSFAWNGNGYGVSWNTERDGVRRSFNFSRLDANGQKIGEDVTLATSDGEGFLGNRSYVFWNGSGYDLFWVPILRNQDGSQYQEEIYLTQLNEEGERLVDDMRLTDDETPLSYPYISVLPRENNYVIFWEGGERENAGLHFTSLEKINEGAELGISGTVFVSHNVHKVDEVQWTGEEYGVSFGDRGSGDTHVFFIRVDANGNEIANSGRNVDGVDWGVTSSTSLLWNGSGYAIAWDSEFWWHDPPHSSINFAGLAQQCSFECLMDPVAGGE